MAVVQSTRLALKTILIATDFSTCAEAAVPYAAALARHFGSNVIVAHVLLEEPQLGIPLDSMPEMYDDARREAERHLLHQVDAEALKGLKTERVMRRGAVVPVLEDIIGREQVDMLVIGTHGRTGLKKLALGSVAEEVLRTTRIPVMVVGPSVRLPFLPVGGLQRIVYATDFSKEAAAALPFALSLAEEDQAHLTLLHAVEPGTADYAEDIERVVVYLRDNLKALLPHDADLWCEPEMVVEVGAPADVILEIARQEHADLIVMGAKEAASPGVTSHSPWHDVHRVIAHAPCPVLTVRT